jgi:hypothetical protein
MLGKSADLGNAFTLSRFVAFIYRFAVVHFNYTNELPENFSSTKKVLHLLRVLEISDAFKEFLRKLDRTYSSQISFLPSQKLICEMLRNEGKEPPLF